MFEEGEKNKPDKARQIVMFELSDEAYGVDLDIVQEVIRTSEITHVPQTPEFLDGVINLRGFVIPVVDIKKRFAMGRAEASRSSRIMIVDIEDQIIGIAVDKVLEVVDISPESIDPPSPIIRGTIRMDYLEGFIEVENRLVKLLNIGKVFSLDELNELKELEGELPQDALT